jgi:hypothetical protein
VCRTLFPILRSAHEERFALAETLAYLRYLERREKVWRSARSRHDGVAFSRGSD